MKGVDVDMGVNRHVGLGERPRQRVELTARQLHVLRLTAGGLTAREVAEVLRLRQPAVASALRTARRRLGARTTAQAVAIAVRTGLLDEDGCE